MLELILVSPGFYSTFYFDSISSALNLANSSNFLVMSLFQYITYILLGCHYMIIEFDYDIILCRCTSILLILWWSQLSGTSSQSPTTYIYSWVLLAGDSTADVRFSWTCSESFWMHINKLYIWIITRSAINAVIGGTNVNRMY